MRDPGSPTATIRSRTAPRSRSPEPYTPASDWVEGIRLDVDEPGLRSMIALGALTSYRIGTRDIVVELNEVEALIQSSKVATAKRKSA